VPSGGRLIALEGPKGVGKSTIASALSEWLAARLTGLPGQSISSVPVRPVLVTKEPTPAFDLGKEEKLRGLALAEAIAEDRHRHVAEQIGPALEAGGIVICDRYILSSYAFHTADGTPAEVVDELNRGFPPPDLNLILRVAPLELARRRGERGTATRLQNGDEIDAYLVYARRMQRWGVTYEVADNATMTDHDQLVERLGVMCALITRTAS
jgi:dTMP kinase